MQGNHSKRTCAFSAQAFAALWAAVIVAAAGGGALAAPTETVLYFFTGGSDGSGPSGLIADSSGDLYGTTVSGGASTLSGGTVFKVSPDRAETVMHSFTGRPSDGSGPLAGLIADSSGNLYGTTDVGGASNEGTVFKLSQGGTETVLHTFTGGSDGAFPQAGLIADSSGNLYGTTQDGGALGQGTVFRLSPGGTETVLYSFCPSFPSCSDGAIPHAGLIADSKGNLYGTTFGGGAATGCGGFGGCGVVFKVSPGGTETVLYSFTGTDDGANPQAGLIADSSGNLYGTTEFGGGLSTQDCPFGCGVVFKLSPSGTETVLHSFAGGSDGVNPLAGLIADSSGNLYGTTSYTVFKLSPGGTETVLYSFKGGISDGISPAAGLIADSSGNLYGTTEFGGASDAGTVFKLTGTGFVPAVQFAAFSPTAMIDFGTMPNTDSFILKSSFTLGSTSKGINPPAQPVTFQIGTLTMTIPPGSFTGTTTGSSFGPFTFAGTINGVSLHAAIMLTGTKRFSFQAGAQNASLTGTVNPVPVTLTIGNNSGPTSVTATILQPPASKVH
ncbi:MAG: choice-of-anchor tandem repeat GloVer-containing protein [Methylocella sp.]